MWVTSQPVGQGALAKGGGSERQTERGFTRSRRRPALEQGGLGPRGRPWTLVSSPNTPLVSSGGAPPAVAELRKMLIWEL